MIASYSNHKGASNLVEKLLQVLMNVSYRASLELRKLILVELADNKKVLLSTSSDASRAILQNFTCAENLEEVIRKIDHLLSLD